MGKTITISIKVDAELLHDLEIYAINHHISRSGAIREAIINLLEAQKGSKAKIESLGRLDTGGKT